jgi:chlorobactene glucosyltransferase
MFFFFFTTLLVALLLFCLTLWNTIAWPMVKVADNLARPRSLSILIPARDEEDNLAACLDAALAQGAVVRELLVYDDHSRDRTSQIIEMYALRDARVRAIEVSTLPVGWCGKTYACAQLGATARGEWILFLDADARLQDGAATRMIMEAEARNVTLLSCWPALEMRSFWESALMPLLNQVVFTLFPATLSLRRMDDASLGLAHGACILAQRSTYKSTGGHALVREEIFEDVKLAQAWRACGELGLCLDGQDVVRVRMYRTFAEIWNGFQKNFFPAFKRESTFWMFMLLHVSVFLLPFVLAPFASRFTGRWLLWLAALSVLAMRAALALRFKHPLWSILLQPVSEVVLIALGFYSWWRCRTGRGVAWKGRSYLELKIRN